MRSSIVATFLTFALLAASAKADQVSILGTASSYGVLAASTITNSGPTVVSGNLGLYGGTSVTGFLPGTVTNGVMSVNDVTAQVALAYAGAGYLYLASQIPTQALTGQDLGGLTLGPGVYSYATSAALTGALTLDFQHVSSADITFIVGTSFVTSAGSSITVVNQGVNDNVFYAVGTAAALGTNSIFAGDILAGTSISLGTGASTGCGSVMALTGAVTMLSNTINNCSSTGSDVTAYTAAGDPAAITPVPEPGTLGLLATGLLAGAGMLRRRPAVG